MVFFKKVSPSFPFPPIVTTWGFSGSLSGSQSRYFFNCELDDENFKTYEFTRDLQPLGYAIQITKYKASLKYLDKVLSM